MSSEQDKILKGSPDENLDEILNLTSGLKVPASKRGKEAIWDSLVQSIDNTDVKEVKVVPFFSSKKVWYSIAASLLVLVTVASLTYRFSTVEFVVSKGQTAKFLLPDNSEVTLNSDSKIEYRKYGWLSNREIALNGEAFFSVKHGSKFTVNTEFERKVIVTGTKFNVMARGEHLEVKCFEGSVTVQTSKNKTIPIAKGIGISVDKSEGIVKPIAVDSITAPEWIKGEYYFNDTSFKFVIDELSRQFNINVKVDGFNPTDKNYTGCFKRNNLRNALDLICIPMDFTYVISADSASVTIKK